MRRPQPTRMETDRERAAATWALEHYRVANELTPRDATPAEEARAADRALHFITVVGKQSAYAVEVVRDEARQSDLWRLDAEKRAEAAWNAAA